jgi:hypothetical protein
VGFYIHSNKRLEMTEEQENLRKAKQQERLQFAQNSPQKVEQVELRVAEAELLLLENVPISLVIYRQGDPVGVIDSTNQDLCLGVLRLILELDKQKLSEL